MDRSAHVHGGRRSGRVLAVWALLAGLVTATAAHGQGTPYLVKDIDQRPNPNGVAVRGIGAAGERAFFAGNDGEHGFELWTSDGTENGTRLVKDIVPGSRGYVITDFTAVGDAIFFVTDDGVHGRELWTSDATEAGTRLVRDLAPGRAEGLPHLLTPLGDLLYFVADDGTHGDELWVTDGSSAGTALVADVRGGSGGARIKEVVAAGGLVWFVANDGVHGAELWSSDGTPEGTALVADLRLGPDGSQPADLVRVGDGVLFSASDGATGRELWRADEASGAIRVADIRPGPGGSAPADLFAAGDRVFFTATTSDVDGAQLFVSDGTEPGTFRLSDAHGQWDLGIALGLRAAIGDVAYFVISTDDGRGAALWRSDGTEAGTYLVKDIKSYPCSDEFRDMVVLGDRLMLVARSYDSDDELWTSDGTEAGTERVKDIFPGQPGGRPGSLAAAGGVLFFAAIDGLHGRELWRSDGTEAGTRLVRDILDGNRGGVASYSGLSPAGDQMVFTAADETIWASDGTAAGTAPLAIPAGVQDWWLYWWFYTPRDSAILVGHESGDAGGLWRYDGTTSTKLADLPAGARFTSITRFGDEILYGLFDQRIQGGALWRTVAGSTVPVLLRSFPKWYPAYPVPVRGEAYFSAGEFATGSELWKTDGTPQGTVLVADVNPGPASGVFNGGVLGNLGGRVLFQADDGVHGYEPFVTDGTPGGTRLLRDIFPGPGTSASSFGARLSGVLYFGARDTNGFELWRTDGTPSGTYRLKDIVPGPDSSAPYGFVRLGDVVVFSAFQPSTGRQLWRTDGTADGTWMVAAVQPGAGDGGFWSMVAVGDVAYFVVMLPNQAAQLWVTDGTPAGTRLAADVSAGAPSAGVRDVRNRNGQLFFTATDTVHGTELWALSCGNGALDELEQCDDGAQNGLPGGCCTGACTLRPGAGDECDPIEGGVVVHRARVQYDGPGAVATGRVALDGQLDADATLPLSLDAGLAAFVEDRAGFTQRIDWSVAECAARANGVLRCARPGAIATFRPVRGAPAGAQRYRFALTASGLDVAGPLAPSLAVKLRTGDRLDRAGGIEDCVARRGALVCRA